MASGGANFRHLYMPQGVGQQPTTTTGKLLECTVAWSQMTSGTSYAIFQRVHEDLPHLESKWMTSMQTFMSQINSTIELDCSGVPPTHRQPEWFIHHGLDIGIQSIHSFSHPSAELLLSVLATSSHYFQCSLCHWRTSDWTNPNFRETPNSIAAPQDGFRLTKNGGPKQNGHCGAKPIAYGVRPPETCIQS